MNYKGHIKAGIITSITVFNITQPELMNNLPVYFIGASICTISTLPTSQLCDLDSNTSKISQKVPIIKILKNNVLFAITVFLLFLLNLKHILPFFDYLQNNFVLTLNSFIQQLPKIFYDKFYYTILFIFALELLSRYFLKHRKLTHSLLFLIACMAAFYPIYMFYPSQITLYIFLGLSAGVGSHILADCLTVEGCPLFYPFIDKKISFLPAKSGDDKAGLILLTCIAIISFPDVFFYIKNLFIFLYLKLKQKF